MLHPTETSKAKPGLGGRALSWLLPAACLGCDAEARGRLELGLCRECHARLRPWPSGGCEICGGLAGGLEPAHPRCGDCLDEPPPYARLWTAWSYEPPLDGVVTALKFRRLDYLGLELGRFLAGALGRRLREGPAAPDVVVAMPLHPLRLLGRGYNQAALIARPLASELGIPLRQPLLRWRKTPPQSSLGRRQRRRNLLGAFTVWRPRWCRGRRILLVDDVVTTGSSLVAAARCLRAAGARSVVAATAARTPQRHESEVLEALTRRRATDNPPQPPFCKGGDKKQLNDDSAQFDTVLCF